jgi:hypothetical protein
MNGATDTLLPDDGRALAPAEFAATAGLTEHDVQELHDYHLLSPGDRDMRMALALREATRLRGDFDLDLFTTGLLARYIRRTHELESQLRDERANVRAQAVYTEVSFTSVEVHGRGG